jgi:hypothetical protein
VRRWLRSWRTEPPGSRWGDGGLREGFGGNKDEDGYGDMDGDVDDDEDGDEDVDGDEDAEWGGNED